MITERGSVIIQTLSNILVAIWRLCTVFTVNKSKVGSDVIEIEPCVLYVINQDHSTVSGNTNLPNFILWN